MENNLQCTPKAIYVMVPRCVVKLHVMQWLRSKFSHHIYLFSKYYNVIM